MFKVELEILLSLYIAHLRKQCLPRGERETFDGSKPEWRKLMHTTAGAFFSTADGAHDSIALSVVGAPNSYVTPRRQPGRRSSCADPARRVRARSSACPGCKLDRVPVQRAPPTHRADGGRRGGAARRTARARPVEQQEL